MSKRLPLTIEIGPRRYRVVCTPEKTRDHLLDKNIWGQIDHGASVITLDHLLAEDKRRSVLLHEVIHGCFNVAGGLSEQDRAEEETIVHRLEDVFLDTLRRNPALIEYLLCP